MKSQGHKSLRRALSLDRLSASFGKKKRFSADMSSSPENNIEDRQQASSGIRTASHRTSYTAFLNWVTFCRDLSPDITEDQRRTCPVCEKDFPDRRSMLQHIPTCVKLASGFYHCIQCNEKEKIGRYHMNGCNEISICQDSWLKRILSFQRPKILVDASGPSSSAHETTQASWERIELPSESLIELDATQRVLEIDGTGTRPNPPCTPMLDGDWAALELDGGLNTWGPVDRVSAWQPAAAMLESYPGWPAIQEMAAWQPQELAGDGYESFTASSTSPHPGDASQESFDFTLLPSHEIIYDATIIDSPAVGNYGIVEHPSQGLSAKGDSAKPFLRVDTGSFVAKAHTSLNSMPLCHDAVHCPDEKFLAFPELQRMDADFPSPPTSPIPQSEHDTPVSPIEYSPKSFPVSRSSRFSSLSSLLMDDSGISEDTNPSARMFDDKEMCSEPDSFDDHTISSPDVLSVSYSAGMDYLPELEAESDLSMLLQSRDTVSHGTDFCLNNLSAKLDIVMSDFFDRWSNSANVEGTPNASGLPPGQLGKQWVTTNIFNIGLDTTNHQLSTHSTPSSPGSDSQQAYTTSSIKSPLPKEDLIYSPKSKDHRSLSRSPAFRAVYRCTYGSCTFVPTGKRAYHKRTLQRHQAKCFYSPLPREIKPCKCTFPGCNKGFSRSDGLNAHRKTSGHRVKIELQVMEENDHPRQARGFL